MRNAIDSNQAGARIATTGNPSRRAGLNRRVAAIVLVVALAISAASPAFADRYNKKKAGHPLRVAAYVLYPVGALIDVLLVRPAHWLISQEPFKSAVGHED